MCAPGARAYWAADRRPRESVSRSIASCWTDRTYVLSSQDADRVPRGAVQGSAEPRQGDALRLVAESLHGLRPPVHLLLRPRVRAAGRPARGRPVRAVDPREGERRRAAPGGARAADVA